ncbi:polysaccharide deacetylase family protein [Lihuaxuella thermophila]|uniref:Peptidoglycan/xylan/chitin deacetylase, PgdA/CDA1 family n=1 Tax=Lihuaxuella thermophila TaxID=1173111 RepID=A0A1H8GSA2_9BACL|nr:polysaccharide deacetylase family protein [Lihuaxuella thermophila]SEN46715.1 Peptidoglycan/xylan/chitin deacetylase, PgdA/CDA1 family [Lihuaxuella thermophila]
MIKKNGFILFLTILAGLASACSAGKDDFRLSEPKPPATVKEEPADAKATSLRHSGSAENPRQLKESLIQKFAGQKPRFWGENAPGVINRLHTGDKVIALTFDACGGKHGNGYDQQLIRYLISQRIPATLFVNSRWIDANRDTFLTLSKNPLFEIENHGTKHLPLSVSGRSVYGIKGTQNPGEVVDEVLLNARKIESLTGRKPRFFRPGTAYYDDVAVRMVYELGEKPVNFDVIGDAGATYSSEQVKRAMLEAKPGSIIILHFNMPKKETAEGVMKAIPLLKQKGFRFVKLEDYL